MSAASGFLALPAATAQHKAGASSRKTLESFELFSFSLDGRAKDAQPPRSVSQNGAPPGGGDASKPCVTQTRRSVSFGFGERPKQLLSPLSTIRSSRVSAQEHIQSLAKQPFARRSMEAAAPPPPPQQQQQQQQQQQHCSMPRGACTSNPHGSCQAGMQREKGRFMSTTSNSGPRALHCTVDSRSVECSLSKEWGAAKMGPRTSALLRRRRSVDVPGYL